MKSTPGEGVSPCITYCKYGKQNCFYGNTGGVRFWPKWRLVINDQRQMDAQSFGLTSNNYIAGNNSFY